MTAIENSSPPFRVLIAEYLLASSSASSNQTPSMLTEAEAMLTALLTDIAGLPNVAATVMLSPESTERFAESGTRGCTWPNNIQILCGELNPQTLSKTLLRTFSDPAFDATFLIAPECDGVLVSLLKTVQADDRSSIRSFNLDWQIAEIFSDKQSTSAWLQLKGLPTIPTRTIDGATAESLRIAAQQHPASIEDPSVKSCRAAVLKPRDGAGADGVRIVPLLQDFESRLPQCSDNDRWLLQPLMPGLACSIGFIGGGPAGSTTILPPALQQIVANEGRLSYAGGQVPCDSAIADRIRPVAEQLATALGPFNGYIGADMIVNLNAPADSPESVCVVEINPRLCTSYVGYRALSFDNLAEWLFQQNPQRSIRWNSRIITFSVSGEIISRQLSIPSISTPLSPRKAGEGGRRPDEGVVPS